MSKPTGEGRQSETVRIKCTQKPYRDPELQKLYTMHRLYRFCIKAPIIKLAHGAATALFCNTQTYIEQLIPDLFKIIPVTNDWTIEWCKNGSSSIITYIDGIKVEIYYQRDDWTEATIKLIRTFTDGIQGPFIRPVQLLDGEKAEQSSNPSE
jgi:hypothetical protein